jgi:hypothetical protein
MTWFRARRRMSAAEAVAKEGVGKESVKAHLSRNLRVDFLVSIIFDLNFWNRSACEV